jgi:hypothetical protein
MRYAEFSRTEFASLLSELRPLGNVQASMLYGELVYPPMSHGLWALWDDEDATQDCVPRVVVVDNDDMTDFLAWAVTFIPQFRPLTAFMRILPWTGYSMSREPRVPTHKGLASVLAGAVLGEALMDASDKQLLEKLPLAALESTYSSTIGRALLAGLSPTLIRDASSGWHSVRQLTGQTPRRGNAKAMEEVWSVILALFDSTSLDVGRWRHSDATLDGCREILETGRLSDSTAQQMVHGRVNIDSYIQAMSDSKERRVEAFENAVEALTSEAMKELPAGFLVGYLASLVSDGSLEHTHLVLPLRDRLPHAMVWYGVCAGLHPNSRVLTDHGHLGLRLVRAFSRRDTLLSLPNCDIALSELEILFRGDPRARGFWQANSSFLRVEVAPMVTTVVRWPATIASMEQVSLFGADDRLTTAESERLRALVDSLRRSLSLAEAIAAGREPEPSRSSQQRGKRRR